MNTDVTWLAADSPHIINQQITIGIGGHLTIEAGSVVKIANAQKGLYVNGGTLTADGDAFRPIVFTSLGDDSVMGDTDGHPR